MPTSLGPAEILVILVIALIVLGPKRLPEAGRQIGRFVSEVRHWSSTVQQEIREVIDAEGEPQPPSPVAAPNATPAPAPPPVPTPADLGPAPEAVPDAVPAPAPEAAPPPAPAPATSKLPPEWSTPPPET